MIIFLSLAVGFIVRSDATDKENQEFTKQLEKGFAHCSTGNIAKKNEGLLLKMSAQDILKDGEEEGVVFSVRRLLKSKNPSAKAAVGWWSRSKDGWGSMKAIKNLMKAIKNIRTCVTKIQEDEDATEEMKEHALSLSTATREKISNMLDKLLPDLRQALDENETLKASNCTLQSDGQSFDLSFGSGVLDELRKADTPTDGIAVLFGKNCSETGYVMKEAVGRVQTILNDMDDGEIPDEDMLDGIVADAEESANLSSLMERGTTTASADPVTWAIVILILFAIFVLFRLCLALFTEMR